MIIAFVVLVVAGVWLLSYERSGLAEATRRNDAQFGDGCGRAAIVFVVVLVVLALLAVMVAAYTGA